MMKKRNRHALAAVGLAGCLGILSNAFAQDPDLKPGFPKSYFLPSGTTPSDYIMVANVDAGPELEIIAFQTLESGRRTVVAIRPDGSILRKCVPTEVNGGARFTGADLDPKYPGVELLVGIVETTGSFASFGSFSLGRWLREWHQTDETHISAVASDPITGELVCAYGSTSNKMWLRRRDGSVVSGWPYVSHSNHQTVSLADLDRDGSLDVVSASRSSSIGFFVDAIAKNGLPLPGWPVEFVGSRYSYPGVVVGNLDTSPDLEVVLLRPQSNTSQNVRVVILSSLGTLKYEINLSGKLNSDYSIPVVADLDADGTPEIIVQTSTTLEVVRYDGSSPIGFPVPLDSFTTQRSAPVVGDLDGDLAPDIAFFVSNFSFTQLFAVRQDGVPIPGFPKVLPYSTFQTLAMADLDCNGRNELILMRNNADTVSGVGPALWIYELGGIAHGPVLWGQYGGSAQHSFRYPVQP